MSSEPASVCVVLHSMQNTSETARCIEALFNGTPVGPVELFVADDTELPRHVPDDWRVTCARGPVLHRGALCNRAASSTPAEYLAFLSADGVPPPDWLIALLARARQSGAEMVLSPLAYASGVRQYGCDVGRDGHAEPRVSRDGGFIAGSIDAMCVRRSAFVANDGFDEHYGSAYEDADFGWRLRISGGRIVLAEAAPVARQHAAVPPMTPAERRQRERNALATLYKCSGDERLFERLSRAITAAIARGLRASRLSERPLFGEGASQPVDVSAGCAAMLTALDDFTCWLPRLAVQRKRVQARRVVSDSAIDVDLAPPMATPGGWAGTMAALAEMTEDSATRPNAEPLPWRPPQSSDSAVDVSVIVLTASGSRHLPDCLDALADLRYPRERIEILVVDNASAESPAAFVASHRAGARLVALPRNLGFCGGNTEGARHARGDWLLFLNDDTRIASDALTKLMETAARRHASCVSALIVNWDGTEVDFGGGEVNFEGKGFQLGLGDPALGRWAGERPVLFASGAGMLVRRELYLSSGGFNDSYFAYYEDVAFGWLLRALGHDVWLNGEARVHHRHHGTSGPWAATRSRLCERNSLLTLVSHLERTTLEAALPAALLLTVSRAALGAGLSADTSGSSSGGLGPLSPAAAIRQMKHALARRGATRRRGVWRSLVTVGVGGFIDATREAARAVLTSGIPDPNPAEQQLAAAATDEDTLMTVTPEVGAPLVALADWLERVPAQVERRREWQAARQRTDASTLAGFDSHWTTPIPAPHQALYNARHAAITQAFALAWSPPVEAPRGLAALNESETAYQKP